ncbi:CoA protein activase [Mahella sp.]|uniref:CoA protein activase n=1 Tax=Mahella sp. TaxID=2798721 RepID=UPI0025C2463E|nr:CoA protein activase [Mahella sp.]MBZ4665825.1 hypothetical protein [Mahella sp.]
MKVTFPHIGNTYIGVKAVFDALGVEVVVPPLCTSRTLELGTRYAPEMACLPLKVTLGNYIESIERGADTIAITGSCGPCRFGYYGVVQQEILNDLGYDAEILILDPPQDGDFKPLFSRLAKLGGPNVTAGKAIKAGYLGFKIIKEADELDRMILKVRPREIDKGQTDAIWGKYRADVIKAFGPYEILKVIRRAKDEVRAIKIDKTFQPLKIGLVGEIYTLIEPFVNLNVEQKLGNLGVEVNRSIDLSGWVIDNIFLGLLGLSSEKRIKKAAKPYLDLCVGGHGRECIGNTVLYSRKGYDGVIQLMPFGCMPEIVAETILPQVSKDENIPVMTLILDEMTGEAGYQTRLEAFVDLLKRKREKERAKKHYGLLLGH